MCLYFKFKPHLFPHRVKGMAVVCSERSSHESAHFRQEINGNQGLIKYENH